MRDFSTEELFEKYIDDKQHSNETARIALLIFNEINKKIKDFCELDRVILNSASLLHDIGYSINDKHHNKHSQKLILEEGLRGFSWTETKIISCIARYHRGDLPDKHEHEIYCELDKKERKIVKQLGGILKIADKLERAGAIKTIHLNYDKKNLIAEFEIIGEIEKQETTIQNLIRKKDLFEIGYKTQVVFKFE